LNDSQKSWRNFFETIEKYIETYESSDKSAKREEFLFDDKAFQEKRFPGRDTLRKHLLEFELREAIDALREKWFSIDLGVRLKARPYLAEKLLSKVK
jgi:hypothetical protein